MADLPELTEAMIQLWVGAASFGRGQRYHDQGRILNQRRQGNTLKGFCEGSQPEPYRVQILLAPQGIASGDCSCPVGSGGHCKHAAALLLTWLHEHETFYEVEDLETGLERRSKAQLIDLVLKMIDRYPDLEVLLELPAPGDADTGQPVDSELIQRQVNLAFARAGHDWGAASRASSDLLGVVSLGDEYAEHENWRNAAVVYETVAREILENYLQFQDDEGELNGVVYQCTEGLARCLEASDNPAQRQELLRALFDVYHWDVDSGGYGIGEDVPEHILTLATMEERRKVAEWVRSVLPEGDSWSDDYHRQAYGGFLLDLLRTELDDESFLQTCRETGRLHDLVERLLSLKRVDEAVAAARDASDHGLVLLADLFAAQAQGSVGERLVRERAKISKDSRLLAWLKTKAEERGDLADALEFAEALFWQRPSTSAYADMSRLAQRLDRWRPLQLECLRRLTEAGHWGLLTEIHLFEGDVDLALETLSQHASGWRWGGNPLSLKVAEAAEESRPQEAIRLYMAEVERHIAGKSRGAYAGAAQILLRVRAVYHQMGEETAWQTLIRTLREKHRRLSAMQDEFNQVGL